MISTELGIIYNQDKWGNPVIARVITWQGEKSLLFVNALMLRVKSAYGVNTNLVAGAIKQGVTRIYLYPSKTPYCLTLPLADVQTYPAYSIFDTPPRHYVPASNWALAESAPPFAETTDAEKVVKV